MRDKKGRFVRGSIPWSKGKRLGVRPRFWTSEKDKILRENYKNMSSEELAKLINCTRSGVLHRMSRLKLWVGEGSKPWNKGKKGIYSKETLKKMIEHHKGQIPWMTGKEHSEKSKLKNRLAHLGRPAWNKGKRNIYSQETLEKIRNATIKQLKEYKSRFGETKIERLMRKTLTSRGIEFETQFAFRDKKGKFVAVCDFAIPVKKMIIECDGEIFHKMPTQEQIMKSIFFKNIANKVRYNKKRDFLLKKSGWTVIRFWGKDINKDVSKCVDKIEEALRKVK